MAELTLFVYPIPGLLLLAGYAVASGWIPPMTLREAEDRSHEARRRKRARWRFGLLLVAEAVYLRAVVAMLAVRSVQGRLGDHTESEIREAFRARETWAVIGLFTTLVIGATFLILIVLETSKRGRSLLRIDYPALFYLGLWSLCWLLHVGLNSMTT